MQNSLDIIVPCYNEEKCIEIFYDSVSDSLKNTDVTWSIIFVNDGSNDGTLSKIKLLATKYGDERVKYVSFSRNFGKESAILAGLEYSQAKYVVLMDADLQHPPALLPRMLAEMETGVDCCGARRVSRKGEPFLRSLFSKFFYKIMNKVTSMHLVQGGSDFRMMTRQVVLAMLKLEERERFTKGIMSWVGFETKWIEYENVERVAGSTKWSMRQLMHYAINGYFAFATAPLRIAVWMGLFIDIVTLITMIVFIIENIFYEGPRTGYGTLVCLIAFFGGTIILLLGIIGEYLARIYLESKKRPVFIIKDTNITGMS